MENIKILTANMILGIDFFNSTGINMYLVIIASSPSGKAVVSYATYAEVRFFYSQPLTSRTVGSSTTC